ncbi:hypothetical protein [Nocardia cyriacigeorgica]|uniref:DUF8020 domain-containing protein n=1 Tax=Nocardia cyriacigeorgica TaxID=135487 RepID=A0A4U8VU33_9NOCA|nr:hypothetical protein [Nocardia cyriacigeorgica]VFA96792.1 Uncharacterised protein [Nocardia cyriacigeorgica]
MIRPASGLAALVAAGTIVAAGPAHAQPVPESTFRTEVLGGSVITSVENAEFALAPDGRSIGVTDGQGRVLAALPLSFHIGDRGFAIRHRISADQRALTLTPDAPSVRASAADLVAAPMEEQLALNRLAADLVRNMGIGSIAGMAIGLGIGAVIGFGSCLIVGPGCVATAPAALGAFAGIGAVTGTLLGGAAAVADAGWKYILTMRAEPGQSPYAGEDGLLDNGTGVPDANLRLPSGSANGFKSGSSGGSSGG